MIDFDVNGDAMNGCERRCTANGLFTADNRIINWLQHWACRRNAVAPRLVLTLTQLSLTLTQ